jgi:hypothetical protein
MQSSIEVVTEAKETALLTLHDAKIGLNMLITGTAASDDQVELMIKWASNEISTLCNRVFAQETVIETILDLEATRIYLSHYPVKKITEVNENGVVLSTTDYNLEAKTGKLTRLGGVLLWTMPTVIKYTGGYDLPQKAPPDLAAAALLVTREAINAARRGDSTIRSISHKESRIMFFDANLVAAKLAGGGSGAGGSAARRSIADLLKRYTRFEV